MSVTIGTVRQIWRYPVSSFAGERLDAASITPASMAGDRLGAFFEKDTGKIVFPSIVRKWNCAPQLAARLSSSGAVDISLDGALWRRHDDPQLMEDLAGFCGTAIAFKPYGAPHGDGVASQRYAWKPLHVVSLQALAALQAALPDSRIDPRRFRPNMVVDLPGRVGPLPEYDLIGREFTVGGVRLRGLQPSGRCAFTTLAQQGLPEDHAVLRALIRDFDKNFGIYCEVLVPGQLALGDDLQLSEQQRPIVIVGAGQAGAMTAKNLRDLGATQPIMLFGEERHPPYERPPLSKPAAGDGLSHVLPHDQFKSLDIGLHLNSRVVAIDRTTREIETEDGARHPYDKLVLATGGTARRLPGVDRGHGRIHVIRTAEDAARLHPLLASGARLAVLGGGWLGLEIAAAARQQGCAVSLFARQHSVLTRAVPPAVAAVIADRHRAEGVVLRLGEMPAVQEHADRVELLCADGVEQADHLVMAIGITPNDHLARGAGLETADGILTDESGATADPDVFALGDVARWRVEGRPGGLRIESWHNANDQAAAMARRLMGMAPTALPVPRFWSAQFDMMIQIAGLPDPAAQALRSEAGEAPFWDFGPFAVGINRARDIHQFAVAKAGQPVKASTPAPAPPPARNTASARISIGTSHDFPPGTPHRIEVPSIGTVMIVQQDGGFFASDDLCPHAAASLSEGFVERGRIICPVHFAEFDLRSGEAFNAPPGCANLRCYEVEQSGEDVFLLA